MRIHPSHILVYYIILPYDYNLYLPRGGDLIHTARDLRVSLGLTILGPTPLGSLIPSGIHKWSPTHLTVWYITVLVVNWHVHCQCHAPLSITRHPARQPVMFSQQATGRHSSGQTLPCFAF